MSLNSLTVKELVQLQRFNNKTKCVRIPRGTNKREIVNKVQTRMRTAPALRRKANELIKAREKRKNERIGKALKRKPKKRAPKKRAVKKREVIGTPPTREEAIRRNKQRIAAKKRLDKALEELDKRNKKEGLEIDARNKIIFDKIKKRKALAKKIASTKRATKKKAPKRKKATGPTAISFR